MTGSPGEAPGPWAGPGLRHRTRLAEQANLATRKAKQTPRSLAEMRRVWREDLTESFGDQAMTTVRATVPTNEPHTGNAVRPTPLALVPGTDQHIAPVTSLAAGALAEVENRRSTWTVWNLRAEASRTLRDPKTLTRLGLSGATAGQLGDLAESAAQRAAGSGFSIRIDAPALVSQPEGLRRADGTSVFERHGADKYTSQAVMDAEARLLKAATTIPELQAPAPSRNQLGLRGSGW